jgi:hypothetical protein
MLQFIDFLEELDHGNKAVRIERDQVERLVERFGDGVRGMGVWRHSTDGSVEVPMANIIEAVQAMGDGSLSAAVEEFRTPDRFAGFLNRSSAHNSSPAAKLIESLAKLRLAQFERKVLRYQQCADSAEADRLRREISSELFGA